MTDRSVSVVVPVYNGARHLGRAIASIEAQRWPGSLQVVVVDDGSSDDTPAVIAALGDRVVPVRRPNGGPAAARNTGLALATGEFVAFLDADDEWPAGKLEHQVAVLEADSALDVVLGRVSYVPETGGILPDIGFEDPEQRSIANVHLGCGVYRRRVFERVGGFDESLRFSEDHDWFLRAREIGVPMRILDQVTLLYHLHDANMTREVPIEEMRLTTVLKRSLDRRRSTGEPGNLARWRSFDDRYRQALRTSVVIPTWNSSRYLAEAVDSVLRQRQPALEVIVVDDGSTDESVAIAEQFGPPVRVVRQAHSGQGSARNHGARLARGELVAFLDADDVWMPDKLLRQVAVLDRADVAFVGVEQFYSPEFGRDGSPAPLGGAARRGILPSAMACRLDVFWRYGGFDEHVVIGEFVRWFAAATDGGARMAFVDEVLVRRRIHPANAGITHRADRSQLTRSLKAVLDRRRAEGWEGRR